MRRRSSSRSSASAKYQHSLKGDDFMKDKGTQINLRCIIEGIAMGELRPEEVTQEDRQRVVDADNKYNVQVWEEGKQYYPYDPYNFGHLERPSRPQSRSFEEIVDSELLERRIAEINEESSRNRVVKAIDNARKVANDETERSKSKKLYVKEKARKRGF